MWRYLLVVVFLFQALQSGLAAEQVTVEAAHVLAHAHASAIVTTPEAASHSTSHGEHCHADGQSHACHDHHCHHTPVAGLGSEGGPWVIDGSPGTEHHTLTDPLPAGSLPSIERPKWVATTSVVVNL